MEVSKKSRRINVANRIARAVAQPRPPVLRAFLEDDALIVDQFAGGGGASSGIASALRDLGFDRDPDIAINHDPEAIAMHKANHPNTTHYIEDVWKVDPRKATNGKRVGLMWASPTCTFFSKARGAPLSEDAVKIRGLCWIITRWAAAVDIDVICAENVEEFTKFGPLHKTHSCGCSKEYAAKLVKNRRGKLVARGCKKKCHYLKPIKSKIGSLYRAFIRRLEKLGYVVETWILRACDYGAPTTRKRWFMVARKDGKPIVKPKPTHGPAGSGLLPYRTAAECIDWSIGCKSIFDRERPLAPKTEARIARGIEKFVLSAAKPFIVPVAYGNDARVHDVDEPLRTVCGSRGGHAIVTPYLVPNNTNNVPKGADEPVPTITTGNRNAVVTPILLKAKTYGGGGNDARPADEPLGTVTCSKRGEHAIATPVLVPATHGDKHGVPDSRTHSVEEPLRTLTTRGAQYSLAVPYLVHRSNGERPEVVKEDGTVVAGQAPRVYDIEEPHPTVVAGGIKTALTLAMLVKNNGGNNDAAGSAGQGFDRPMDTIACKDQKSVAAVHLVRYNGERLRGTSEAHVAASPHSLEEPMPTISAGGSHMAKVSAYLVRYNGTGDAESASAPLPTVTTKERFALVKVHLAKEVCAKARRVAKFLGYQHPILIEIEGEQWVLVDIGLRMLVPRELFNANSFDPNYEIECAGPDGEPLTKTAQIRMAGNSVPPVIAKAIARAQLEAA